MQFLSSNDLYFDVGANYGNRIEPIINDGINIIAIEPQRKCVDYLKKKYKENITVIPKGLGEKKGKQTFYLSDGRNLSSFSEAWIKATKASGRFKEQNWNKTSIVEIETLDNLISKYGKPQFIKIDVEGYEFEVLKGLSQPIKTISFEYTSPERNKAAIDCIDRILEINGSNEVLFNYSVGESLNWALNEWLPGQKMKEEISNKFLKSKYGDIYAKTIAID